MPYSFGPRNPKPPGGPPFPPSQRFGGPWNDAPEPPPGGAPFGPDNPFWSGLEEDPEGQRVNYFRFQDQFKSPNQQDWFRRQFQGVQDRYRGLVGQQITGPGGRPSETWTGFLNNYFGQGGQSQMDYLRAPTNETGRQTGRFAPSARWMVGGRGSPQF